MRRPCMLVSPALEALTALLIVLIARQPSANAIIVASAETNKDFVCQDRTHKEHWENIG